MDPPQISRAPNTLLEHRLLFSSLVPALELQVATLGLAYTGQEWVRSQVEAAANAAAGKGILHSLHLVGLAIDLNLYRGTEVWLYLNDVESYRPLGEYWESLHPLCRWGGRFERPDADHFSLEYQGVR